MDARADCEIADYNQALTFTGSPSDEITQVTGHPPGMAAECSPSCHRRHNTVAHPRSVLGVCYRRKRHPKVRWAGAFSASRTDICLVGQASEKTTAR
jgi:hypothetical protein